MPLFVVPAEARRLIPSPETPIIHFIKWNPVSLRLAPAKTTYPPITFVFSTQPLSFKLDALLSTPLPPTEVTYDWKVQLRKPEWLEVQSLTGIPPGGGVTANTLHDRSCLGSTFAVAFPPSILSIPRSCCDAHRRV
jgi:hypothetical protein